MEEQKNNLAEKQSYNTLKNKPYHIDNYNHYDIDNITVKAPETYNYYNNLLTPENLKRYKDIDTDIPKRLLAMAEKEQEHRHANDKLWATEFFKFKSRGQWFAVAISLTALIGGIIGIYLDHIFAGTIFCGFSLTPLASLFLRDYIDTKKSDDNEQQPEIAELAN